MSPSAKKDESTADIKPLLPANGAGKQSTSIGTVNMPGPQRGSVNVMQSRILVNC